jgi:uracil-DNA glycosylase
MVSIKKYKYKPWNDVFAEEVDLERLKITTTWHDYFGQMYEHGLFNNIEKKLTEEKNSCNIFPYPRLLFNAFNKLDFENIKVVIIGQDPYSNAEMHNDKLIPQAMGLSFSVPNGMQIPSSLNNIYKNQIKYGSIFKTPDNGNLQFWNIQGCLMLNTTLTVQQSRPNSHGLMWQCITDKIIKHISAELDGIVFVLWGNDALGKLKYIDLDKHHVTISSHPSGLAVNKPLKDYKPFCEVPHFEKINKYLIDDGKSPIIWQIV